MTIPLDDHDDFMSSGFGSLEARFDDLHNRVGKIEGRFDTIEQRFDTFDVGLKENTEATKRIDSNIVDLVEFARAASWIGKMAKPFSYTATTVAAVVATWFTIKGGK